MEHLSQASKSVHPSSLRASHYHELLVRVAYEVHPKKWKEALFCLRYLAFRPDHLRMLRLSGLVGYTGLLAGNDQTRLDGTNDI